MKTEVRRGQRDERAAKTVRGGDFVPGGVNLSREWILKRGKVVEEKVDPLDLELDKILEKLENAYGMQDEGDIEGRAMLFLIFRFGL